MLQRRPKAELPQHPGKKATQPHQGRILEAQRFHSRRGGEESLPHPDFKEGGGAHQLLKSQYKKERDVCARVEIASEE
ncbi:hypothetical protein TNIN_144061 [Trichonephila inaurata madagascariensis]|uniref:Uncharacterized protein n=1 Tax=Trichonephila inaurata madagascariensis TaxID=2747483 RepID=A0A8X6X2M8_9ARAC|nr:hypothetical protein TNIN_144061 [Trichonephila inaurata madagascariensis]